MPGRCSMDEISQYRKMHEAGYFQGPSILKHRGRIGNLIHKTGAKRVLDYGCGGGKQYSEHKLHENWGVEITAYDPAVERFSVKPKGRFHGVVCTDVLEHIPEEGIDGVLKELTDYAERFLFLSICCRPAKKFLPDGRNCHLTVMPEMWWLAKIAEHSREGLEIEVAWNE